MLRIIIASSSSYQLQTELCYMMEHTHTHVFSMCLTCPLFWCLKHFYFSLIGKKKTQNILPKSCSLSLFSLANLHIALQVTLVAGPDPGQAGKLILMSSTCTLFSREWKRWFQNLLRYSSPFLNLQQSSATIFFLEDSGRLFYLTWCWLSPSILFR